MASIRDRLTGPVGDIISMNVLCQSLPQHSRREIVNKLVDLWSAESQVTIESKQTEDVQTTMSSPANAGNLHQEGSGMDLDSEINTRRCSGRPVSRNSLDLNICHSVDSKSVVQGCGKIYAQVSTLSRCWLEIKCLT
jgi:hypothetical protein